MPRTSRAVSLTFKSVRAKLPIQRDPHWHLIVEGQHLGYRKTGDSQGTWVARYYVPGKGRRFKALGQADDTVPANGTHVLSFQQAQEQAQKWFSTVAKADAAGVQIGPYTVADAAAAWIVAWTGSAGGKANSEGNLKHHILPALGAVPVNSLRREQVHEWLQQLATKPPVKSLSEKSKSKFDLSDPETQRRRRDTANRIFNDLSALLTLAYENGRCESKRAWDTVPKFDNVARAKNEYLSVDEAKRFLAACPPDFGDLVRAAITTGCRYTELASMTPSAYDGSIRAVSLRQPKSGKVKHVFLTDEEAEFFARVARGKRRNDLLFRQADGSPWVKSSQQPRMRAVLRAAGIKRHVRFHDLRHTFATLLVQQGVSLQVVANQLGHSGTRVAEEHYAHFSPEYIASQVRGAKPKL